MFDAKMVNRQKEVTLSPTHKIRKVVEMFKYFLEDKTADKTAFAEQLTKVSTDKMMLISRIIYTIGYGGKDTMMNTMIKATRTGFYRIRCGAMMAKTL